MWVVDVRARLRMAIVVLLLGGLGHATTSRADDVGATKLAVDPAASEESPPEEYLRAVDLAVAEHERGYFLEAREHFRAAHEIYPNARSLRGLGKVEFELRNYGECVRYLTEALSSRVRPLTDDLRAEVEEIRARARVYVGEVHVDVQPESASVSVDGVPLVSPATAVTLEVGEHTLEFRADGRASASRRVTVRGNQQIHIHVTLTPLPALGLPALTLAERAPGENHRLRGWAIALTSVAVVGAAIGLGLGLRNRHGGSPRTYGGTSDSVLDSP
jgi:hypothetical protein